MHIVLSCLCCSLFLLTANWVGSKISLWLFSTTSFFYRLHQLTRRRTRRMRLYYFGAWLLAKRSTVRARAPHILSDDSQLCDDQAMHFPTILVLFCQEHLVYIVHNSILSKTTTLTRSNSIPISRSCRIPIPSLPSTLSVSSSWTGRPSWIFIVSIDIIGKIMMRLGRIVTYDWF